MGTLITAKRLTTKKRHLLPFTGHWKDSFGQPKQGSRWMVYGNSGNGKTEFCVQLSGYLSNFGKILYISQEQGDCADLARCFSRHGIDKNRRVKVGYDYENIEEIQTDMLGLKAKTVVFDSIDYLNMNLEDYKKLDQTFPKTNLVFVAWADGRHPAKRKSKDLLYMVGVKVRVDRYMAIPISRSGGSESFVIWEEGAKKHWAYLNR